MSGAGEVRQVRIACGVPVVAVDTVARRGELLRLNHRLLGAAQGRDLLVNELCQFARHATSRSRKAPLVSDSRARAACARGRAWRADRPSQRLSASLRVQGQRPIFRADFCGPPQSAIAEAVGATRTPPRPGRMLWDQKLHWLFAQARAERVIEHRPGACLSGKRPRHLTLPKNSSEPGHAVPSGFLDALRDERRV
jgi:hypothetical protein